MTQSHDHGHHHEHDDAHDHGHGAVGHVHAPTNFGRAFAIAAALNIVLVITQVIYGVQANSVALLADAGHNFGDVLGLLMAWGAHSMAQWRLYRKSPHIFGRVAVFQRNEPETGFDHTARRGCQCAVIPNSRPPLLEGNNTVIIRRKIAAVADDELCACKKLVEGEYFQTGHMTAVELERPEFRLVHAAEVTFELGQMSNYEARTRMDVEQHLACRTAEVVSRH